MPVFSIIPVFEDKTHKSVIAAKSLSSRLNGLVGKLGPDANSIQNPSVDKCLGRLVSSVLVFLMF